MKIMYLLPPSEGKNQWWILWKEELSFIFEKPYDIAVNATEKDLKCKGLRYDEGIRLNTKLCSSPLPQGRGDSEVRAAIERYSWVMYNAIDYAWMSGVWKKYFEDNFLILSGMYGIVLPQDTIGNYKLPIETKWLYKFWWDAIRKTLDKLEADYIVDMLPGSYAKMIDWKNMKTPVVRMNFLHRKDGELKKITHGVKKVKGEYVYKLCNNSVKNISDLGGNMQKIWESEYAIDIIS